MRDIWEIVLYSYAITIKHNVRLCEMLYYKTQCETLWNAVLWFKLSALSK